MKGENDITAMYHSPPNVVARLIICGLLFFATMLHAETITGKCVGVSDGDTATILVDGNRQAKIRFWGIDAPESRQDFGQVAKKKLSDLIFGKVVSVDITGQDRYGRNIGKVYVGNTYANLEMVKSGLAWHYVQYAPNDAVLAKAEQEARSGKVGLWSHASPTPPWQWRRGDRTGQGNASEKQAASTSEKQAASTTGKYWISSAGKVHNKSCRYYGCSDKGKYSDSPKGVNCRICGGAGDKTEVDSPTGANKEGTKYWVTSTGKTHAPHCRYYGTTKRGYYTTMPTGDNCKKCGGAGS